MAALNEYSITKVATVAAVDMKTAGKTTLYTVPTGKTFIPIMVIIRSASATLVGGTWYNFGTGTASNTWRKGVDLQTIDTAATDYVVLIGNDLDLNIYCTAGSTFGIYVVYGSTGAATCTIDVFGYLL